MTKRKNKKLDYYGAKAVRQDDEIIVCALDVETDGLGGKLLMAQWGSYIHGVKMSAEGNMMECFLEDFFTMPSPAIWYSHFASYDWRYLLDKLTAVEGVKIDMGMRTHTDIYEIRVEKDGEKFILRDSYAIFPHPLKDLAKHFCPELPKLDLDFDKEKFDPQNAMHVEYAKRDIEILLTGLPRYFDMVKEHFSVYPTGTVAGTSLKSWQRHIGDEIYNCSKWGDEEIYVRQGYYGGLVFLTTDETQYDVETYDKNSSYPDSMCRYGVPYGRAFECRDFESGKMGIYKVRVKAPSDIVIPIIPARNERGAMRWQRGEFDTVCTSSELIFAANQGYEIQKIYTGLAYEDRVFPFNEYINLCKFIRTEFKGEALEIVAKLMQNSLYGKFGSRRERLKVLHAASIENADEILDCLPMDELGEWLTRIELDEEMRCMPHWAVFITAHSRLSLLQTAYSVGVENVIYGDTDSLTIKKGHADKIDVGLEYGQWKHEKSWREFRAIAPKVYAGILDSGKYKGAAKGLPRKQVTEDVLRELLETGESEVSALSLASLKTHIKKGESQAVTLTRKSSTITNSVNFERHENGRIRVKLAS